MLPRVHAAFLLAAAVGCIGCASSSNEAPAPPPNQEPPPGTPITITTMAPSSSTSAGGKTNATWAAYRKDDGSWAKLTPTSVGTYVFAATATRWAVAFSCTNDDNALVAMHEDAITVTSVDVTLATWCAAPAAGAFTISGTLSNLSAETGWLDFGYALEARGAVLPVTGTSAKYEEVNVTSGTWDFAFGIRNDSTTTLSKIALVRNHVLTTDGTLDLDLAGASAVTPGTKRLSVHGLGATETLMAPVQFASNGGERGIDVGPPSIATAGADVDVVYSTIPAEMQVAADRYRLELTATGEVEATGDTTTRGATGSFHDAIDADLTLVQPLGAPVITGATPSPYVRLEARTPARPAGETYEVAAVGRITNREFRHWRTTIGAALVTGPEVTMAFPDLAAAEGFNLAWSIPADVRRDVTVTVREKPVGLGDGTVRHFAAHTTKVRP